MDPTVNRYKVPKLVVPHPSAEPTKTPKIGFKYTAQPFSFSIIGTQSNETLFFTEGHPLIFKPQYVRVKSPPKPKHLRSWRTHQQLPFADQQLHPHPLASRCLQCPQWHESVWNHPIYFPLHPLFVLLHFDDRISILSPAHLVFEFM